MIGRNVSSHCRQRARVHHLALRTCDWTPRLKPLPTTRTVERLPASLPCTTTGIVRTIAISKCDEVCYLLRLKTRLNTLRSFIDEIMHTNRLVVVTARISSNHILLMKPSYVHGSNLVRHSHVVRQFLTRIYHSNKLLHRHHYLELVPLCFPSLTILDF